MEKIPSDEFGDIRHSHLLMPLVTYPVVAKTLNKWIDNLENDDWLDLASESFDVYKVALLTDMCRALIEDIGIFILKYLKIQISAVAHEHEPKDNKITSADASKLRNSQPLFDGCSYCRVTQRDVQASFGDILDTCFGQFLETEQKQSYDSVRLCTLLSVEIAKYVNSALSKFPSLTSVRSVRATSASKLKEIVPHVINILHICMKTKWAPLVAQCSLGSDAESPGSPNLEGDADIQQDSSESCRVILPQPCVVDQDEHKKSPGCSNFEEGEAVQEDPAETCRMTLTVPCAFKGNLGSSGKSVDFQINEAKNLEQDRVEIFESTDSKVQSTDSLPHSTACPPPQLPKCSVDETFLVVCLAKLIDHTANKTHTSIANLDFHQIVTSVKERLMEDQSYPTPQSVKNFHITIYKELCRKFRSKYLLQFVMEKYDADFAAAFVDTLKRQLEKSMEKPSKFKKLRRIFRRNNNVCPACENKSTESHSEENEKKNVRQKNTQSRISRICSSIFSGLRKAFTCCITKHCWIKSSSLQVKPLSRPANFGIISPLRNIHQQI